VSSLLASSTTDPRACTRGVATRWFGPRTGDATGSLIDRLLAARGVAVMERESFLRASLSDLERPWDRPDVLAAADAILEALDRGRRIAIYGDYDVDGITATAILWRTLTALQPGAPVRTYVPHRIDEGYGLNAEALRTLAAEGIETVVTVDCGVTAVDEAALARHLGLELIITDHHRPREDGRLPDVRALVHPALDGREHRFRDVCGALVAWKLAWAMLDRRHGSPAAHQLPPPLRDLLTSTLALAAIGTVADVMPLVGENRAVVRYGIAALAKTEIPGLRAMLALGDVARDGLASETIAFRLAPRLNACGRLGSAEAAVRLLTTATEPEASAIVKELDGLNNERRATERRIYDDACARARDAGMTGDDRRAIVLASPDWHAGVVGIVCSRLVDTFGRPAILLQEFDDIAKGSGRSIRGFSLLAAIQSCGETPLKSGGHDHAAGITLKRDRVQAFADAFVAHASKSLTPDDLVASIDVDAHATVEELDVATVGSLEQLAPFGRGNPRPRIRLDDVVVTAPPRVMGKSETHLMFHLKSARGTFRKAKWWDGRRFAESLRPNTPLDVVVEPKIDTYLGDRNVELEVKDVRVR
jgi:single-stranded-DNA-specific exonuclease